MRHVVRRCLAASSRSPNNPPAMPCLAPPLPPAPHFAAFFPPLPLCPRCCGGVREVSAQGSSGRRRLRCRRIRQPLAGVGMGRPFRRGRAWSCWGPSGSGPGTCGSWWTAVSGTSRGSSSCTGIRYKEPPVGSNNVRMVEFLQSSVVIIHRNHAESITSFPKENVEQELKKENRGSAMQSTIGKRITFCVEGNISVGKFTFLQKIANETLELRDLVEIVPEPVSKWQEVGPDHFNILGAFYAELQRYAYTFQNYVFVTRLMQEKESSGGLKPLRLMEHSIFSDRMVRSASC